MRKLNRLDFSEVRPEVIQSKRYLGLLYGICAGITFAFASWGMDGFLLSKSHGYLPWLNLVEGAVLCTFVGGLQGWLTARFENSLLGLVFWCCSSLFFAWLTVSLPLQITPYVVSKINPRLGSLLNYSENIAFIFRFGVALVWVTPFTLIIGITQLPITESAVFSTSVFGRLIPFFFCIIVMGISGYVSDSLINAQFRTAIRGIDNTIQFVVENKYNKNIDPALSREMRAASLIDVQEYVKSSRHLFVGSFDEFLGELHVFVNFDGPWIDCDILYGQPISCELAVKK
jgi:hypothetical protein